MSIKRMPVIISDTRENMLFSKKMGLHSMPTFHKISELSSAFNLSTALIQFCHPILVFRCFIIRVQLYLPPIQF